MRKWITIMFLVGLIGGLTAGYMAGANQWQEPQQLSLNDRITEIQREVGVAPDGVLGPVTAKAVNQAITDELVAEMLR